MRQDLIPHEIIENKILFIRGKKIMLDKDLAILYGVTTGNSNKAVKRNIERFPDDFMFQLTKNEADSLSFQIGILKEGKYDYQFKVVFDTINQLIESPKKPKKQIGFQRD